MSPARRDDSNEEQMYDDEDVDLAEEGNESSPPRASSGRKKDKRSRRDEEDEIEAIEVEEEEETAKIPEDLLTRILHEFFAREDTRISKSANKALAKYFEVFVGEAIARTAVERPEGSFLEVRKSNFSFSLL